MAWSKKQIVLHIRACRSAGIQDEHRKLILRQLPNAMFTPQGRTGDEPSSRSAKLDNVDFEYFMATVEQYSGGRIKTTDKLGQHLYAPGHWQSKSRDWMQRMRRKVLAIAEVLEAGGCLEPGGVGLAGWIERRVANGRTQSMDELEYAEIHALINGLRAYARRHRIRVA